MITTAFVNRDAPNFKGTLNVGVNSIRLINTGGITHSTDSTILKTLYAHGDNTLGAYSYFFIISSGVVTTSTQRVLETLYKGSST